MQEPFKTLQPRTVLCSSSINGVLISESASILTFRRAEAKETSLLRSDLEALRDTGRSLMPEGLEKNIDTQAMADLISWLMTVQ